MAEPASNSFSPRDFSVCKALVVEPNPTSRSILVGILRELGFETVVQVTRPPDALKKLEYTTFDFIFCEYHFDNAAHTGQAFLDDLRQSRILPLSTAFMMVTHESTYEKVSEAVESALDSYILKPFVFNKLRERFIEVRKRKYELREIFASLEAEDFKEAIRLCEKRVEGKAPYWLYAARLGAELSLRAGEHERARELYEVVLAAEALPWAKLGLARSDLDGGKPQQAKRTLEALLADNPSYADAYDVMGRAQSEQGELEQALETYRQAVALTPASLNRLQKLGQLSFLIGDREEASKALTKAFHQGVGSRLYDYQSLMLLCFIKFDEKDGRFLNMAEGNLAQQVARAPESRRFALMYLILEVLDALRRRQTAKAVELMREFAQEITEATFDFEMACNFLSLVQRVNNTDLFLPDEEEWVSRVARRFCVTKISSQILSKCLSSGSEHEARVSESFNEINGYARDSLTMAVNGRHREAVLELLRHGKKTLNAKLIETAKLTADRHKELISDWQELMTESEALRVKYCSSGTQVSLGQTTTSRAAGGIALRL